MPIKPHKGESQSDFMARCVPEMIGTGPDKRPQDQAVAACMQIWRDRNKKEAGMKMNKQEQVARIIARAQKLFAKNPKLKDIFDDVDFPEPMVGENRDDYVDRCADEAGTTEAADKYSDDELVAGCEATAEAFEWDENDEMVEDSMKPVMHKLLTKQREEMTGMDFILSDETPDRFGDVIVAVGWQLDNFKKNPIALFGHKSDFPIGKWKNLHVENNELRGNLELAPAGTSERIDELRKLVKAGILKAVSVGFKPMKYVPMDKDDPWKGTRYLECELVETSLVSIPANPNALAVAKALDISAETIGIVFAEKGRQDIALRRGGNGGKARRKIRTRTKVMTPLSKRIEEAQTGLTVLKDKLMEHLSKVDDSNVSDTQLETTTELNAQILQRERQLTALLDAEKHVAASVAETQVTAPTVVKNGGGRPFGYSNKKIEPLEVLVRAGTVALLAHKHKKNDETIRQLLYPDDEATKVFIDYCAKAASAPAMTTVAGWAQELVTQIQADIMETLMPKSVYPRLAALGLSLSFGRSGRIIIPTRSRTPTIAGSFVGEGAPIPVRQGAFTSQTLVPKKMAVITTWTREIDESSVPAIEGLLRQAIQEDTAVSLDSVLLDSGAATAIRPPGILNGVAGLTPTAGGGFTALVGDLKQLSGALLTATQGHLRALCWLMNPQQVLSASLTAAPGVGAFPFKDEIAGGTLLTYPIIDSGTVPLGTVIALDAADFVSVGGEAPRFEISDQATLHMEDTTPLAIASGSGPTVASPTRSLWQTDSLALRLILPINWTLRRTGVVSWVAGVTW
jgi:HK97 family phage prohead protease/HK97 family phage major capsid protein